MARISVDQTVHSLYSDLADKSAGKGQPLFSTMKDVFMLSFSLGAARGARVPLSKVREIFDARVLSDEDWATIEAVAIAEFQDLNALNHPEDDSRGNLEVLKMAEEYANGGIELLRKSISPTLPGVEIAITLIEDTGHL